MVAVGFATDVLLLLRLLVRRLLLLLFPYTTLGLSSLTANQIVIVSLPVIKEGQVCGLRAKVHVCRCGAFSVPRFDLVLDLVFFLYQAVYKLRKGPASRLCLWASTVPTKKGPLETGVPMGFDQRRIELTRHARGKETHALRDPSHAYSIRRSSFRTAFLFS